MVTAADVEKAGNEVVKANCEQSPRAIERMRRSVGERGDLATLKFLWEIAGLFLLHKLTAAARVALARHHRRWHNIWMILTKVVRFLT